MAGDTILALPRGGSECLNELMANTLPELIWKMTGISLEHGVPAAGESAWATIYTIIEGKFPLILALCTPYLLMKRAACSYTGGDCTESEVAECALEFFNVFCGHVVAQIYGQLGCSAMMYPPRIVPGRYFPVNQEGKSGSVWFTGGYAGEVELRWCSPAEGLPAEELELFRRREI